MVDGYSTDATLDIVSRYPARVVCEDKRARFPSAARDLGWRQATGDLIVYLDSDGSLEPGFFPKVYDFFREPRVGLLGCEDRTAVTNAVTRANAQERAFLYRVQSSTSSFFRLYRWLAGVPRGLRYGGACHVVRRSCLEDIGGFPLCDCGEDLALAQRVVAFGWRNEWWSPAPVVHRLPSTVRGLCRQFFRHGRQRAVWEWDSSLGILRWQNLASLGARLASPGFGAMLAANTRNPVLLVTYPVCRYAWLAGYVKGARVARRRERMSLVREQ